MELLEVNLDAQPECKSEDLGEIEGTELVIEFCSSINRFVVTTPAQKIKPELKSIIYIETKKFNSIIKFNPPVRSKNYFYELFFAFLFFSTLAYALAYYYEIITHLVQYMAIWVLFWTQIIALYVIVFKSKISFKLKAEYSKRIEQELKELGRVNKTLLWQLTEDSHIKCYRRLLEFQSDNFQ